MNRIFLATLTMLFCAITWADDAEDAGAKLYEYFAEFNDKDIETVANYIYSTPVHIGGGAGHSVLVVPPESFLPRWETRWLRVVRRLARPAIVAEYNPAA